MTSLMKHEAIRTILGVPCHIVNDKAYSADGTLLEYDTDAVDTEIIRLQSVFDSQLYARNRAAEYPPIESQLDEIYHNGVDSWNDIIKVTKDKYPKNNTGPIE
jgi:hypothetical protein